jgi:hypothetical protein
VNWSGPIDLYCERLDASFWAEPVNALTNGAFLLAAVAAWLRYRKSGVRDFYLLALIGVVALIAFGSFAFHTLATRGAALLDTIPIAIFVYSYLALALRRFVGVPVLWTTLVVGVFFALSQGLSTFVPRNLLNGSFDYLPPLTALYAVALFSHAGPVRLGILQAAAAFTVSLVFRTIDQAVCSALPLGTHFVWHVLNAWVLYRLLRTAIDANSRAATRQTALYA